MNFNVFKHMQHFSVFSYSTCCEFEFHRGGTPRRKLSLSSIDTPPTQCNPEVDRIDSSESGKQIIPLR